MKYFALLLFSQTKAQVKPVVTDYDPITDDFLVHHHVVVTTQESLLVPPDAKKNQTKDGNGNSKVRPKSAPKHRRASPAVLDYPSNEDFSEEEIRLPVDDDEGNSSAVSDQDHKPSHPESPTKKPANGAEKVN